MNAVHIWPLNPEGSPTVIPAIDFLSTWLTGWAVLIAYHINTLIISKHGIWDLDMMQRVCMTMKGNSAKPSDVALHCLVFALLFSMPDWNKLPISSQIA